MRKLIYIVLGLALVATSVTMFTYRWVLSSSRLATTRTTSAPPSTRGIAPTGTRIAPDERIPISRTPPQTALDATRIFDVGLNILNALVGIIGIWVGIAGMRMQRAR